jgi:MFS family permease
MAVHVLPPTAPESRRRRRSAFGIPASRGNGKLLGAAAVDSVGSGLVLAFIVVYFVRTTSVSLPSVGGALTLARLLASPTAVAVGPLIDRFGARRVAASGNAVSAVGYAGFLAAHQVWVIVLVAWLAQIGAVTYWTSSTGLVVLAAAPEQRPRWFAVLGSLRNIGLGFGGAVGAFLIGAGGVTGLRVVVVANALSYVVACLLLTAWRPSSATSAASAASSASATSAALAPSQDAAPAVVEPRGGYRTVLRDRRYLLLIGVNIAFVFSALVLSLLLTVFVTDGLHRPAWIGGVLLTANTVQVSLSQPAVTARLERIRPCRVIAAGAVINAVACTVFALVDLGSGWTVAAGLALGIFLYSLAETVATPFQEELSVSLAADGLGGRYLAVYQLSWTFGQTAAPGLFAVLLTAGPRCPWLFLTGLSLTAVPALLVLERMVAAPAVTRTTEGRWTAEYDDGTVAAR